MRVYVIASDVRIAPFGDLARDLQVGTDSLSAWQDGLFRRFGLERVDVESAEQVVSDAPCLVTYDNVFFTRRVLKSFLKRTRRASDELLRLALPRDSEFVNQFCELDACEFSEAHALFDFWWFRGGGTFDPTKGVALEVIYEERVIEMRMPERITGLKSWRHPLTTSICLNVRHWVHVLHASRLTPQICWVDRIVTKPWTAVWPLLRAAVPTPGRFLWRLLRAANALGRNVDVHPTAVIEGCIIEDDVRIGAQAIVRGAVIGRGTVIEDRANVAYSAIGPDCMISKHTLIYASAIMSGANIGSSMQLALAGRESATTPRSTPMDVTLGGPIKVWHRGALVALKTTVLGPCLGHQSLLGANIFVAPGREIPNGIRVLPNPGQLLKRIPADLDPDSFYGVEDGTLVPL